MKRARSGRCSTGDSCGVGASTSRGSRRARTSVSRPDRVGTVRPYITATVVVVTAQLLLIAGLLRQRARLRRADNTIRAREASLRTSYERIRQMAGRLINAQEAARADIARDLHDDICQKLAYVSIGVNSLRSAAGNIQDPETQQAFEELDREMRNTFEGIRRLSHDLHPATLRLLGLAPALRSHCNEVAKRQGVEVEFSSREGVGTVHPDVAVCFFRIAQESLRNGIVHGGAKHLAVTLTAPAIGSNSRWSTTARASTSRGAEQRQRRPRTGDHGGTRQPGRRHDLRRQRARPRHDGESACPRESTAGYWTQLLEDRGGGGRRVPIVTLVNSRAETECAWVRIPLRRNLAAELPPSGQDSTESRDTPRRESPTPPLLSSRRRPIGTNGLPVSPLRREDKAVMRRNQSPAR